jgi:hypothetical protein
VRRVIAIVVALLGAYVVVRRSYVSPASTTGSPPAASVTDVAGDASIAQAFASHAHDVRVHGAGTVSRVLSDDNQGDRHQRFIVRLSSGQSILIVHNIDLAPRVANVSAGDAIEFEGEYVWNAQGGVVHWTHHDPAARHQAGWIRYRGRTYQ